MRSVITAAAIATASMLTSSVHAGQTSLAFTSATGLEGLGSFTGSMNWNYAGGSATSGYLTISLTNTSSMAGYLTAFAFNGPSAGVTYGLQTTSAPAESFGMIGGGANPAGLISASPWDAYDVGASVSNQWLGGGSPKKGLQVGETGTYVFNVNAVASLLAGFDVLSCFADNGDSPEFAVRFRGFANGGSDKVGGLMSASPPPTIVPVPLPVALAAAGLLLGFAVRRRAVR